MEFRLLTYNVHGCRGTNRHVSPRRTLRHRHDVPADTLPPRGCEGAG
jgi:endonuclease/exonuclease/phosphatase family metal-dependent hydrolase